MYFDVLVGFCPNYVTIIHIGGNINKLPCLHSISISKFGNVVFPFLLLTRYKNITKNLVQFIFDLHQHDSKFIIVIW